MQLDKKGTEIKCLFFTELGFTALTSSDKSSITGSFIGQKCLALDTSDLFEWNGTTWQQVIPQPTPTWYYYGTNDNFIWTITAQGMSSTKYVCIEDDFVIDTNECKMYQQNDMEQWIEKGELKGAQGPTGLQGATGEMGTPGVTGATGAQGFTGPAGSISATCFKYLFDTSTVDSDPGTGLVRVNNASVELVTELYIDDEDCDGDNISSFINSIINNPTNNSIPGHVKIARKSSGQTFALYAVSAGVDNGTYTTLTLSYVAGDSGSIFTASEELLVCFATTGDRGEKGDIGMTGPTGPVGPAGGTNGGTGCFDNLLIDNLTAKKSRY